MECLVTELNCLGLPVSFHELLCCEFHFLITLLGWLSQHGLLSGPSSVAFAQCCLWQLYLQSLQTESDGGRFLLCESTSGPVTSGRCEGCDITKLVVGMVSGVLFLYEDPSL